MGYVISLLIVAAQLSVHSIAFEDFYFTYRYYIVLLYQRLLPSVDSPGLRLLTDLFEIMKYCVIRESATKQNVIK